MADLTNLIEKQISFFITGIILIINGVIQKQDMHWLQSITEDNEGFLWIGTDGGLLKFDKKTEKFTLL